LHLYVLHYAHRLLPPSTDQALAPLAIPYRTYNESNGVQAIEPDEEYFCDSEWTAFLWEDFQGNTCFAPHLRKKLEFRPNLRGE
jgi:hypothetical protein